MTKTPQMIPESFRIHSGFGRENSKFVESTETVNFRPIFVCAALCSLHSVSMIYTVLYYNCITEVPILKVVGNDNCVYDIIYRTVLDRGID